MALFVVIKFTPYIGDHIVYSFTDGLTSEERAQWAAREVRITEQFNRRNSENISGISKDSTTVLSQALGKDEDNSTISGVHKSKSMPNLVKYVEQPHGRPYLEKDTSPETKILDRGSVEYIEREQ